MLSHVVIKNINQSKVKKNVIVQHSAKLYLISTK
jgi:hypothetical protein